MVESSGQLEHLIRAAKRELDEGTGRVLCVCGAGEDGNHEEFCPAHPRQAWYALHKGVFPKVTITHELNLDRDLSEDESCLSSPQYTWEYVTWDEYADWLRKVLKPFEETETYKVLARCLVRRELERREPNRETDVSPTN